MKRYIQKWSEDRKHVKVIDKKTRYSLSLCHITDGPFNCAHTTFDSEPVKPGLWITGRDIQEYDQKIRDHIINPAYQYIEVGAGLGEFTPRLVETFGDRITNLPIVIDPANYNAMNDLLEFTLTLQLGDRMKEKLYRLNKRCKIIRDQKSVKLINLTLEEALKQHPEVLGIADVVVDNAGASHYTSHESTWQIEKRLLRPAGLLFSEVAKSGGVYRPD